MVQGHTANVQKENHVKVTGKEGKEQENIGAQAVEIMEQAPVVHAVQLIFWVLLSKDLPKIIQYNIVKKRDLLESTNP